MTKYVFCWKVVKVGDEIELPRGFKILRAREGSTEDRTWIYYLKPK